MTDQYLSLRFDIAVDEKNKKNMQKLSCPSYKPEI